MQFTYSAYAHILEWLFKQWQCLSSGRMLHGSIFCLNHFLFRPLPWPSIQQKPFSKIVPPQFPTNKLKRKFHCPASPSLKSSHVNPWLSQGCQITPEGTPAQPLLLLSAHQLTCSNVATQPTSTPPTLIHNNIYLVLDVNVHSLLTAQGLHIDQLLNWIR